MICEYTHIAILLLAVIVIYLLVKDDKKVMEGMADANNVPTPINYEAIQTLASLYNTNEMTVGNLTVKDKVKGKLVIDGDVEITGKLITKGESNVGGNLSTGGNLTVSGETKLANWRIKNDRIGIPGRADIAMADDLWVRNVNFDGDLKNGYNGVGFAGGALWTNGIVYGSKIDAKEILSSENYVRLWGYDAPGCDLGMVDIGANPGNDPDRDLKCLRKCKEVYKDTTVATINSCGNECWCKHDGCGLQPADCRMTRSINALHK